MCIIIANQEGKLPSPSTLVQCQSSNRDGIGLAWRATDGTISFRKGIKLKHLQKLLVQIDVKKLPYVIHFRSATSCGIADRLCHPFPLTTKWEQLDALTGDGLRAVVAHNGTWHGWKKHFKGSEVKWLEDGNWSDSSIIAWLLATGANLALPTAGYGNRLAFLSRKAGLKLWGTGWVEEEGIHYSNTFWRYVAGRGGGVTTSRWRGGKPDDWDDWNYSAYFHHSAGCQCQTCLTDAMRELDEEQNWMLDAAAQGWKVGSGRGIVKKGKKHLYVAQDGTSWCVGHRRHDRCWTTGGYSEEQARKDAATAGVCEIASANKALVESTNSISPRNGGLGLTRNYLLPNETVISNRIFKRVTNASGSYLVRTDDWCFEAKPIVLESGNAEDREASKAKETTTDGSTKN